MQLIVDARSARHVLFTGVLAITSLVFLALLPDPQMAVAIIVGVIAIYLVTVRKLDYTDSYVVFALPWMMIIGFSLVSLSDYSETIHRVTYEVVLAALFMALLGAGYRRNYLQPLQWKPAPRSIVPVRYYLAGLDTGFLLLTILNVAIAGYVPLVRGITTGDTGYLDFGVHGLYGFYLAFANAIAIFYAVLYMRTGRKRFVLRYCVVVAIFILFVTRQNLISLGVETVIAYSIVRKKIPWRTILILMLVAVGAFSLIGMLRSGSIKEIASIKKEYMWIPDPVIWIYCYSYFNIANVDNLITFSHAPYFNGSSLANLIPSFLRPSSDIGDYLQLIYFNVSSYIYPIYADFGVVGIAGLTYLAFKVTERSRRKIYESASLFSIGTFSVLYFCAAFSFFVNFWFYLPVIFQVVFFKLLSDLNERAATEYKAVRTVAMPVGA